MVGLEKAGVEHTSPSKNMLFHVIRIGHPALCLDEERQQDVRAIVVYKALARCEGHAIGEHRQIVGWPAECIDGIAREQGGVVLVAQVIVQVIGDA